MNKKYVVNVYETGSRTAQITVEAKDHAGAVAAARQMYEMEDIDFGSEPFEADGFYVDNVL